MGSELPIRLIYPDKQSVQPSVINADPALFTADDVIKIGDKETEYRVDAKQLHIDASGRLSATVTLKSTRSWFDGLDEFAAKHDTVFPMLGTLVILSIALVVAGGFVILAASDDTKLAYVGYAIARAPAVLFVGTITAMAIIAKRLQKHIGNALSFAVGMSGAALGFVFGALWEYLFLPQMPRQWPAGYVQLAREFWQHSASLTAVGAAYAPVILLILKYLHLDFIGTIASVFAKKKAAD